MSTEARDKAWEAHRDRWQIVQGRSFSFTDFRAGWDARGQVTPDRPTEEELHSALVNVLSNVSNFPVSVQVALLGRDMRPLRDKCVAAILALFNEKGNE